MTYKKESHYFLKTIMAFFFISIPFILYSQTENNQFEILGEVYHKGFPIENAHIINISNTKNSISDSKGKFNLITSVNDTIEIRCLAFEFETIIISKEIIQNKLLKIELNKRVNELKEVVVSRTGLSGDLEKDLQNIPYDVIDPSKKLGIEVFEGEPEEKIPTLLQTFGLGKFDDPKDFGLIITIQPEPLYKHISGYYKRLKNKRSFDKETKTVDNILYFYGASFFQVNYNIKPEQLYNFLFFCVETDDSLVTKFENKNYSEVLDIFNKKAINFNK